MWAGFQLCDQAGDDGVIEKVKAKAALFCGVFSLQAERIMEALELYKDENRKMEEHRYVCQTAGKEVETESSLFT